MLCAGVTVCTYAAVAQKHERNVAPRIGGELVNAGPGGHQHPLAESLTVDVLLVSGPPRHSKHRRESAGFSTAHCRG